MIDIRKLPLSEKQIDYVLDSDAFVNLAEGAIRSGKTISGLLRWLTFIAKDAPSSGDLIVCSKTYDTAARNIFNPLRDAAVFGELAKSTTWTRGAPTATILGQKVDLVTFNDERSESRLRGMTCRGGYVDEWSLMPKSFHEQLIGRCSVDGSQLFGNTNPDNPRHWLKEEINATQPGGKNELDWKTWHFQLDDNPKLSDKVKARYRRQYTGLWYKRMILGQWVMAEGSIYESWDEEIHVVKTLPTIVKWISLGIDHGTVNPFAGLILGLGSDGCLYLTHEWRWDSKKRMKQLTDVEYSGRIREWLGKLAITPEWWCVDPSAANFRLQLLRDEVMSHPADNSVVDGVRMIGSLFTLGLLKVHESCEALIAEIPGYVWDDEKAEKGEDAPIKLDDHSCDAMRYAIKTPEVIWRPLLRHHVDLAA